MASPSYRRLVIKLGTSVLTGDSPRLDEAVMVDLARQAARLHAGGLDVILCSSGAIAAGRDRLGMSDVPATVTTKQMLAAVGQSRLMHVWERLFGIYRLPVAQLLLTRADVDDRDRYLNARDALQALLAHRVVPIVNENDAVATSEIRVGDNDNLSALVALLAEADLLLLLTDQPGLFTADPRQHPNASLIPEVRTIDATLRALAGDAGTAQGTGGMATKLQAADLARRSGVDVVIAAGHAPDVILRAAAGEPVGTRFPALATPVQHRKRWILAGNADASVHIDAGAARALRERGGSLLPAGVAEVRGTFDRGDTVRIEDPEGMIVGRGLARYDHEAVRRIQGCQSDAIADRLGYSLGPAIIHRDDLVLLRNG